MAKVKTRRMPSGEYAALLQAVFAASSPHLIRGSGPATSFTMVDSDFLPTQNMAEVRFIAWDNMMDCGLLQVDAAGDAIVIESEF